MGLLQAVPVLLFLMKWSVLGSLSNPQFELNNIIRIRRSIDLASAHGLQNEPRLDGAITPLNYTIFLVPNINDATFKGTVDIDVFWLLETDSITLHCSHDLAVDTAEVLIADSEDNEELKKVGVKRTEMDIKKPMYTIKLDKTVSKNTTGKVSMTFSGEIATLMTEGLFKIEFNDGVVKEGVIGTKLRPNNARRVFPCFDEPGFKTPFNLKVVRVKNMAALFNTPVLRVEDIQGETEKEIVIFETTPPMSTFALGLIIGNLKRVSNESIYFSNSEGHKLEIRVWGRREFLQELKEVHEKVIMIIKVVTSYWTVPFPLKKLDIVALPNYQGVRPADNWGLIVFKESELSMKGYLQLSQELIYQWLGTLVSPAWWSDAQINKALVGYLAAETAIRIDNGSEMDGKWPMTVLYSLYYEYSKRYPHSRITGMKQETSSIKIELLFRMFNYTLGNKTFKKGLNMFLQERKFKTFTGTDVWNSLNKAALEDGKITKDISMREIATSWINKDRLPYVAVNRNYDTKTALLTQKVFLRERPHDIPDADKLLWWIPIILVRADNLDFNKHVPLTWMRGYKDANIINLPDKDSFVIVNPDEIAPFPVNYDKTNWELLAKYLQTESRTKIPALTRAKLLHDAWNLAYAGYLDFSLALNMTRFMTKERNHIVWDPVFTMIDHIGRHIDSSQIQKKFEAYIRSLLIPLYEEYLGGSVIEPSPNEDPWRTNLRSLTKTFLCRVGYKPCIQEAQAVFRKWMEADNPDEGNPIPNQFICPVLKWGTIQEWEFALQRVLNFPSSRKPSERTYLLKTLAGCPISKEKILKLLNLTILEENSNFTENDMFLIFSMLTGGSRGYKTLYFFVRDNWDIVRERFASKTNLWDSIITSATSMFTTSEGLDLVTDLYLKHQGKFGSAEHIIEKSLKNIREEVKWTSENLPHIEKWLNDYLENTNFNYDQYIGEDHN